MAGGDPAALEKARPVLEVITARQLHLGACGTGAAMKLAVNIMIAATNHAVAEALALAAQSGISVRDAYAALTASAVSSPFLAYKRDAYLSDDDAPVSFTTALMSKDLQLALAIAGESGLALPLTAAARQTLEEACAAGLGDADFASIARLLRSSVTETTMTASTAGTVSTASTTGTASTASTTGTASTADAAGTATPPAR